MNLTVDAEEADRLVLSLEIFEALARDPARLDALLGLAAIAMRAPRGTLRSRRPRNSPAGTSVERPACRCCACTCGRTTWGATLSGRIARAIEKPKRSGALSRRS
jgi:hypothetical protein